MSTFTLDNDHWSDSLLCFKIVATTRIYKKIVVIFIEKEPNPAPFLKNTIYFCDTFGVAVQLFDSKKYKRAKQLTNLPF